MWNSFDYYCTYISTCFASLLWFVCLLFPRGLSLPRGLTTNLPPTSIFIVHRYHPHLPTEIYLFNLVNSYTLQLYIKKVKHREQVKVQSKGNNIIINSCFNITLRISSMDSWKGSAWRLTQSILRRYSALAYFSTTWDPLSIIL